MRDLNPRPIVNKTIALPTELTEMIPAVGFEPTKHYTTHLECAPFVHLGILVFRAPREYLVLLTTLTSVTSYSVA